MGKQYVAIATICWGGAALWTTLIGTSISSSKTFGLLHDFDYKKIIAEEFDIAPSELVYDHCSQSFGTEGSCVRYDEDHIVRDSEEFNVNSREAFVHLTIFEN